MTDESTLPPAYGGETLHVHLDTGEVRTESIDPEDARRFLGGNGFVAKAVYDHVDADTDAFDPGNVVASAVGPMNATPFQSTSRGVLGFVSPMTDGFFDSTFGGTFPRAQKTTGFDLVTVHGRAAELSYVVFDEDGARVESAPELAGMDTYETCAAVRAREGDGPDDYDTHVLAAGPAGETQVRFACLLHDSEIREGVAGRGGPGAVFGSKNLKALAVREGSFEPELAAENDLRGLAAQRMRPLMDETKMLQEYGTAGLVNPVNEMGKLGVRNNQREQASSAEAEAISGETLREKYVTEDTTCANCAVRCGKHVAVENEGLEEAKIPEFESIFATASMQDVFDVERMVAVNDACDRLGMDSISFGVTVAFARECHERGLFDTDSAHLQFGDADGLVALASEVANREGVGDRLAEGSFRLADDLDGEAERYLHGSKGLEFAAHSPRGLKGMSIGYATATRGGSHHDTRPTPQYGREDPMTVEEAPEFAARNQHFTALGDSLTQCRFVSEGGWGEFVNDRYRDAINLVTGWDLSTDEVERIGERVYTLERLINVERGVADREADSLPYRVTHEPIPDGPAAGMYCPPEELETMLDAYYGVRGWDDTGVPTEETLARLDMEGFRVG